MRRALIESVAEESRKRGAARLYWTTMHDNLPARALCAGLTAPARRQERHKATLFGMAVAPHATGRGIGKALVLAVLGLAADLGVLQVGLTVTEGNLPASRLYRSCGFTVWGREPRAVIVAGQAIAKLHMVRILDEHGRHSPLTRSLS